jgi:ferredoxin
MPNIIQYRNKCIGCGACVELQPGLWRMSKKDGKATLLNATIKNSIAILPVGKDMQKLQELITSCPVKIIQVI